MSFRQHFLALSLFASLLCGGAAQAAEPETGQDEYDFSWLDPEKKIYVVQNRKYLKQNRLEISLAGGLGMGEPYRTRYTVMPRATFYMSEQFGLSIFGGFNRNSENGNVEALRTQNYPIPAVRDVQSFVAGSIMWLPFYGKINMFNQIFYIDWHIEAGVGQVASEIDLNTRFGQPSRLEETSHFAFHWGTGQKFFITRNWAARLDFVAQYYKAPSGVDPNGGNSLTTASGTAEDNYDNYYVTLGVSYTF